MISSTNPIATPIPKISETSSSGPSTGETLSIRSPIELSRRPSWMSLTSSTTKPWYTVLRIQNSSVLRNRVTPDRTQNTRNWTANSTSAVPISTPACSR